MKRKKFKLQYKRKKKLRKNPLFHLQILVMMIHHLRRNHKKKKFLQKDQELLQMLVVKAMQAVLKLKKQLKKKLFQQNLKR